MQQRLLHTNRADHHIFENTTQIQTLSNKSQPGYITSAYRLELKLERGTPHLHHNFVENRVLKTPFKLKFQAFAFLLDNVKDNYNPFPTQRVRLITGHPLHYPFRLQRSYLSHTHQWSIRIQNLLRPGPRITPSLNLHQKQLQAKACILTTNSNRSDLLSISTFWAQKTVDMGYFWGSCVHCHGFLLSLQQMNLSLLHYLCNLNSAWL